MIFEVDTHILLHHGVQLLSHTSSFKNQWGIQDLAAGNRTTKNMSKQNKFIMWTARRACNYYSNMHADALGGTQKVPSRDIPLCGDDVGRARAKALAV